MNMKVKLSLLWLFALLNYLYCDLIGLMDPELLKQFLAGNAGRNFLHRLHRMVGLEVAHCRDHFK